jgi:hypothetical protein
MKFSVKNREVVAAPTPVPGRARTMEEVATASTSELSIKSIRWRYSLNFFGDVSFAVANKLAGPDHAAEFVLGDQDVLLKGELNNHIVATTEFALEHHVDGVGIDIERYNIRWQAPSFYVEVGRSHTSLGYWNNAYHHGRWLQLTIERPRWVAFEDDEGVLPVHWVGLNVGGKIQMAGGAHVDLVASVGNGRGRIVDDVRTIQDFHSMKAFHGSVEVVGLFSSDLRFGISGVIDQIPSVTQIQSVTGDTTFTRALLPDPNITINEMIGGAHIAYPSVPLIFIAEGYTIIHSANVPGIGNHSWATFGGFGLLGYALGRVTPYIEVESFDTQGGPDPFFIPDPMNPPTSFRTAEGILGVRVDLSDWTALKAEYRATRLVDTGDTIQVGIVNWSWGF